jgi:lysophospholipase L1-like esterase
MKIKYIWLLLLFVGLVACDDDNDTITLPQTVQLTAGSADFSTYVSIGNSLTAGFADGALFKASQENSFPNILSQKFAYVGGGSFTQPLMNDNFGGISVGGNRILQPRLVTLGGAPLPLESVIGPVTVTTDLAVNNPTGPFNNMGVPGAASFHLIYDGYGSMANLGTTANPYFIRMASASNATVLGDALAQAPSFVSLWIGNNDVLGYATSGGSTGAITPQGTFDFAISTIMGALQQANVQGVMANIPYVETTPHFTTVTYNPLDPENPDFGPQIPTLNATFAALNGAFAFLGMPERSIVFSETEASAVVIHDESLANIQAQLFAVLVGGGLDAPTAGVLSAQFSQSRQATENDLLVLPSSSVIATVNIPYYTQLVTAGVPAATAGQLSVNGVTFPLADKWVLVPSEQAEIKAATDAFNATLKAAADSAGFAFVDANALMKELSNGGIASGNYVLTSDLVTGGVFSLDGVHPNSRGYGLISNEFLKAIDATYGSNFEAAGMLSNVGDYPTNYSPLLQ